MEKGFRLLRYLVMHSIFLIILVMGALYDVKWCENFVTFFTIVVFILLIIVFLCKDMITEKEIEKGFAAPLWVGVTFDLISISIMAAVGWFWLAGLCLIHMIFTIAFRQAINDSKQNMLFNQQEN